MATVPNNASPGKSTNFPRELVAAPRWGTWKYDGEDKIPDPKINQPQKWKAFSQVADAVHKAFLFVEDDPWFSIDLDWKKSPTKKASAVQLAIIDRAIALGMYKETSPSKLGVHLWGRCDKSKWPRSPGGTLAAITPNKSGVEMYAAGRYFTMTANADAAFTGELPDCTAFALELFATYKPEHKRKDASKGNGHDRDADPRLVKHALTFLDPDCSHNEWVAIGQMLHDWGAQGHDEAFGLWDAWSATSKNNMYPGRESLLNDKWRTFTAGAGRAIASLFDLAKEKGFNFTLPPEKELGPHAEITAQELMGNAKPKPKTVRQLNVSDAHTIQPKKIAWVWLGRIARKTLAMVVGVQGDGKSIFVGSIIASLTSGKPFVDGTKPLATGRVILISGEEDAGSVLVPRLDVAGADLSRVKIVTGSTEHVGKKKLQRMFSMQDDVNSTRQLLKEYVAAGDPAIAIVVDPLTAYMAGKKKIDAYNDSEVREVLMPWVQVASDFNIVLLVVAHFNKSVGLRAVHRVANAAAAPAVARAVYLVSPANGIAEFLENNQLKIFAPVKFNLGKYPPSHLFTIESVDYPKTQDTVGRVLSQGIAHVTADDVMASKPSQRQTPLRAKIIEALTRSNTGEGGLRRNKLANAVGQADGSEGFVSAIRIMVEQGALIDQRGRLYTRAQADARSKVDAQAGELLG